MYLGVLSLKVKEMKAKINRKALHFKNLHGEGNHQQNENKRYWIIGNICKWYDLYGINIQHIQAIYVIQHHKKNQPY